MTFSPAERLDAPDDTVRLIYLLALGIGVLGFFLYGRRHRWGKALRDVAIWTLIFAMMIIAYGFRDVLRQELFPGSMVQMDGGSVALRRGMDGHFRAVIDVNEHPVRFIVDTGASDIVLSLRDAAAVGIDVDNLRFSGRARTANGVVSTAPIRLQSVGFGEFFDSGVAASVNAGRLDVSLLGMGYLSRFARIEIEGDRMILHR